MATLQVIERTEIEHSGPIALCKGGGGDTVDKEYNKRMANIAERQQGIADEYFKFWETTGKPYEQAQMAANMELMPYEVATQKLGLQARASELQQAKPVMEEYYKQALEGVNPEEQVQRARADVAQGIQESEEENARTMERLGISPGSPAYAEQLKTSGIQKAKAIGAAMTTARTTTEQENFQRLQTATQSFKGGINF